MPKTKWPAKHRLARPQPTTPVTILQRLRQDDPSALDDCEAIYGEYVSELAKYNTASDEEADLVAARIFDDIGAFARSGNGSNNRTPENELIHQIAVRRIVKQSWKGQRAA